MLEMKFTKSHSLWQAPARAMRVHRLSLVFANKSQIRQTMVIWEMVVTGPSFCTTANERVYITARGCETLPSGGYGLPATWAGGR